MRYRVYFISLFAYLTIHIMRMAIPFVQLNLAQFFNLHNDAIGFANSTVYIILGCAYMYRVMYPIRKLRQQYFYFVSLCCLFYALIPLYVLLDLHLWILLFISMGAFGLFQSTTWPIALRLVSKYFDAQKDGFALGVWSANADFGNIVGFVMCTLIIYSLKWQWSICLIVAPLVSFLVAILLWRLPNSVQDDDSEASQQVINYKEQFIALFRHMKHPKVLYLVFILCLLKALLYGVLLWIPMYLQEGDFEQFSGYIPIAFSSLTILGSVIFGYAYEKIGNPAFRNLMFIFISGVAVLAFWAVKITPLEKENEWLIFLFVGVTGFCIPGKYNVQAAHETLLLCEGMEIDILRWSSLMESLGYIFVGLFQIVIGISTSISADSLFIVFSVTNLIGLAVETFHLVYQLVTGGYRMRQVRDSQKPESPNEYAIQVNEEEH